MDQIHRGNSLNNIKDNRIIQVTNMLFMPKEKAKEAMKKSQDEWLAQKRKRDQKRREEYLKNKQKTD